MGKQLTIVKKEKVIDFEFAGIATSGDLYDYLNVKYTKVDKPNTQYYFGKENKFLLIRVDNDIEPDLKCNNGITKKLWFEIRVPRKPLKKIVVYKIDCPKDMDILKPPPGDDIEMIGPDDGDKSV